MATRTETKDVAGVFDNEKDASAAVERLIGEHFGACNELSVIVSRNHVREAVRIDEPIPVYRAAAIGAAMGAGLGALIVVVAGIGFGPFTLIEWGPLWAAFEAAYVGGSMGLAVGAMMSFEMGHPKADFGAVGIHDGVVWVSLHASEARAERARAILAEVGARHVMERGPEGVGPFTFSHAA
ncbi:MAG: hypothetical protein ABL963_02705 [Longimicrobiales bacterium]